MGRLIRRFAKSESGATAIEYGLLVGCLSMVVVAAASGLGSKIYNVVSTVSVTLNAH